MTDTHIRYIELFVTAIKTSSFTDQLESQEESQEENKNKLNHTPTIYLDYLSLHESIDNLTLNTRSELDGISRVKFQEEHEIKKLSNSLERKVRALYKVIDRIQIQEVSKDESEEESEEESDKKLVEASQRKKMIPHAAIYDDIDLRKVYSFYMTKRAHKHGFEVILFDLPDEKTLEISNMLQTIGKDYLRLHVLEEIETHLEFNEYYSMTEKRIIDTAAEACHWISRQLIKNNHTISRAELLQKVLNEFHIKRYASKSTEERERLTKKAVNQWMRDNNMHGITA